MADDSDWRLRGQEDYLQGATLMLKSYRACSAERTFSPDHARLIAENPEILTEGYAVQDRRPDAADGPIMGRTHSPDGVIEPNPLPSRHDYWWICAKCVADFADRFGWTIFKGPSDRA